MQGIKKAARILFAGLLAIAVLAWQAPSAEAAAFIKFEGVKGESTDKDHQGWIDVLSVQWGSTSRPTSGRAAQPGRGAGTVSITKQTDTSSAALMRYNSSGKQFEKIVIDITSYDRSRTTYMRYELRNVMITGFEPGGSGGGVPTETITFNYDKIKIDYMPQKPSEKKRRKY